MNKPVEVAAYYFPNFHVDARNEEWHGSGWTEWNLVKAGTPRFPGHQQPKVPLWGYLDESKPEVAEKQIEAASTHGITSFIYDWYWYENRPFLNGALEKGYMKASNNSKLKFSLMWANHDWVNIFPYKRSTDMTLLAKGHTSRSSFDCAADYMIEHYFSHPSYMRLDGKLYFSIYELMSLVGGLGGVEEAWEALDSFRRKVRAAGLGELHLNAVIWGVRILPTEKKAANPQEMLMMLGMDSVTSYVWMHHTPMESYPYVSYSDYARQSIACWEQLSGTYPLPYYPNVSMGWDSSPRTVQSDLHAPLGYPHTAVLVDNTPAEFKKALEAARNYLEHSALATPMLTINSWNEWTEGSYLEPDTVQGMGYLEAVKEVFGSKS